MERPGSIEVIEEDGALSFIPDTRLPVISKEAGFSAYSHCALYSYFTPDMVERMTGVIKTIVKSLFGTKGKLQKLHLPVSNVYVELIKQLTAAK